MSPGGPQGPFFLGFFNQVLYTERPIVRVRLGRSPSAPGPHSDPSEETSRFLFGFD